MAKIKTLRSASDKSISHRAAMLSSIAKHEIIIRNYLFAEDTVNTIRALENLGVNIEIRNSDIIVNPVGKYSFKEPQDILDMGNSGTGIRLLSGLLSGFEFLSILKGDDSLKSRPMMRIIEPLSKMGAKIMYRQGGYAPLVIYGKSNLNGIRYESKIASAQVKSAILFAGLYSDGDVCVKEPIKSRNHTENMFRYLGIDIEENNTEVCLGKNREIYGDCEINVPADISSSAFFVILSILSDDVEIVLKDVCLNETRSGILHILSQCGANYEIDNKRVENNELVGDLIVKHTKELKPFVIDKDILPSLIDEIPILSILGIFCDGVSIIKDASELRKKESDRIKAICSNLSAVGVKTEEFEDGFKIYGKPNHTIRKTKINTYNDHRIAMSFTVLSAAKGVDLALSENQSIKTSYPGFFDHLNYIIS